MNPLTENISQIVSLTPEEKESIERAFSLRELRKGDLWIQHGKVCDEVAYVESGQLRVGHIDDAGNELTCFFVTSDSFISSFTSFLTHTPTNENISALEETTLRVINRKDLEELSVSVPKMQVFRRVIAENLFITMENRIVMLQSQSANQRYEKILRENPDIVLTVPLQYIASFLGITPQHLSRLRNQRAR